MNPAFPHHSRYDPIQSRLFSVAALFLFLTSAALTLAPTVRLHTWNTDLPWHHWIGFFVWLIGFMILHRSSQIYLPKHDPIILPLIALLTGWGLMVIWRLEPLLGYRQTLWMAFGMLLLFCGIRIRHILEWLKRGKNIWLVCGLALVALTFLIGTYPAGQGPQLWLKILGLYIQPSEPLKLLLIIYLAGYLAENLPAGFSATRIIIPTTLVFTIGVLLLVFQRDLGTSYLVIVLFCSILYIASGKRSIILFFTVAILAASVIGFQIFDVIRVRVEAWLFPWSDPGNRSFQIVQSMISIASGRILGEGLGLGSPGLVPLAHSDFIFTSICEEFGLIGSLSIIFFLILLTLRGMHIAIHAHDLFNKYVAGGVTILLISQSILIIGGNLRLLPLTGLTLPFFSYGGSSLITSYSCCLLYLVISNQNNNMENSTPSNSINWTYRRSAMILSLLLISLGVLNVWWSIIRAKDLQKSTYNLRPSISDRFVARGDVLFRNGKKITGLIGKPGEYQTISLYPPLNPVLGYSQPFYGQTGLLSYISPFLQGTAGYSERDIRLYHLLYSQSPPGLDVRTSIDADLQNHADRLLADHAGAILLMNAHTGEILVMASHPYFDVNDLSPYQSTLSTRDDAPLLNRNTQGQYPAKAALYPVMLTYALETQQAKENPLSTCFETTDRIGDITSTETDCLNAGYEMVNEISGEELITLYRRLEFDQTPDIPLPSALPLSIQSLTSADNQENKQSQIISVSPLQMALASATLCEEGKMPAPQLLLEYHDSDGQQHDFSIKSTQSVFSPDAVKKTVESLRKRNNPVWDWSTTSISDTKETNTSWYIAGTVYGETSDSLVLVIALENSNQYFVRQLGENLFSIALQP